MHTLHSQVKGALGKYLEITSNYTRVKFECYN